MSSDYGGGSDESLFGSESDFDDSFDVPSQDGEEEDIDENASEYSARTGKQKKKPKKQAAKKQVKKSTSSNKRTVGSSRNKKKSRFEQLMESAKKEVERQTLCETAARMQFEEERELKKKLKVGNEKKEVGENTRREEELKTSQMMAAVRETRRRLSTRWSLTGAILSNSSSLEEREPKPDECKIERHVMVKRHNFFPFFDDSTNDPEKFFSEPTSLCCVWCTEPCDCVPVPCPVGLERGNGIFKTFGFFCSFECMLSYARQRGKVPLARLMMKLVYDIPISEPMGFAPSRLVLQKYGGSMSLKAYRGTARKVNLQHEYIALPFIPVLAGLEEIERVKTVVSEYGDADKVRRIVNSRLPSSISAPIDNTRTRNMQRSEFSKMPTLEQQLERSEQELRLQLQETGLGKSRKRSRTMMDFMKVRKDDT